MYDKVVDADAHVLEPMDLWDEYLEPRYRHRGIKWRTNAEGLEYWEVDGRPAVSGEVGISGSLGGVGAYPDLDGDRTRLLTPGVYTYLDGAPPGSMDPHERVRVLDDEGIDVALIYPTLGIFWEEDVNRDPELAMALARAYNNWLHDFCQAAPERLFAIAHIPILDVAAALTEMQRTARRGARGFFVRPDLFNGRTLAHPDYDALWALAQDLDLPIAPHVVVRDRFPLNDWSQSLWPNEPATFQQANLMFNFSFLMLEVQAAFTAMVTTGVFERFPRLKYVILESGAGWIAHWLERLDGKYKVGGMFSPLREPPSFYFKRQCYISVEPDEKTTPAMVELLGEDNFVWASDFPHIDAEYGVVAELKENLAGMSDTAVRKLLGANAANIYNLPQ